jgi:site-specific recombinase XerD
MNQKLCRHARAREAGAGDQVHIISEAFACDLRTRGYANSTIGTYCRIAGHFGRWLCQRQIWPKKIRPAHVEGFLRRHLSRCHCDPPVVRSTSLCRGALHRFLDFLRREQLIPDPPERAPRLKAADRLFIKFDQHLDRVQGLAALTRQARGRYAREFLEAQFGRRRLQLRGIKPVDLLRFVNARALTLKRTSLHALVVGLRSFLRFLEFSGRVRQGLADAVPSPACPPPQPPLLVLDLTTRRRFLCSFDRTTCIGRRDYAMALCFAEMALRANEVAALALDDVDWRASTLRLRQTKQRRERLLPLPPQVARALVAYLQRGRPAVEHRLLFVTHWAPPGRPLSTDGVRHAIGRAFARCGIEATGPHILRRSWATLAHRRGADLKLIADILGHQSLETTAPYAQVHFEELRQAALPWPRSEL